MKYISNSTKETAKIAKEFAGRLRSLRANSGAPKGAIVVGLSGELGAGKTTFTKSFAMALGIKETVKSPTFNILKKYEIRNTKSETISKFQIQNSKFLYHIDAYRLNSAKEILDLGWKNLIKDNKNIILVEWAENIKKVFPKCNFWVTLRHIKERSRSLDIHLSR